MTWQVGTPPVPEPHVRLPAVAGAFYPAHPAELAWVIDSMVDSVMPPGPEALAAAYVVPHAGYRYSGAVAARVYARLRPHADHIRRIVVVGPAHHVPVRGCVVSTMDAWRTPLGDVPLDVTGMEELVTGGYAAASDTPHAPEHSLEVQLPFLQRAVPGGVPVLPVLVGAAPPGEVAEMVAAAARLPGSVVLCSTDLSHYLDEDGARTQDAGTAHAVLSLAAERIGPRDACGASALRGVITWARRTGRIRPRLLELTSSAQVTGDRVRVVGYGAFAFEL